MTVRRSSRGLAGRKFPFIELLRNVPAVERARLLRDEQSSSVRQNGSQSHEGVDVERFRETKLSPISHVDDLECTGDDPAGVRSDKGIDGRAGIELDRRAPAFREGDAEVYDLHGTGLFQSD